MGSDGSLRLLRLGLWWWWWWFLAGETAVAAEKTSDSGERELYQTPTWAVAAVCTFFIVVSVLLEKVLHKVGTVFWERRKKALLEALEKVKSELMILGFISLLITFGQNPILKICIPSKVARTMLPCRWKNEDDHEEESRRKLLWYDHRFLSGAGGSSIRCPDEDHEHLISAEALHQLHLLIFFLAVFHVLYSFLTMMLGRLKIRGWKHWEQEVSSGNYEFSVDPSRFRLTHETSFVRAHASFWTRIPFFFYVGCFFRQFFRSVRKTDYLTLRNGFISAHLAPGSQFNFQKYIKRSLEDDFKLVVGVSPVHWASFVIYLFLNVHDWNILYFGAALPVIIILAVGTKLQAILTKMALEITDRHSVVQGMPLVQGSDRYFWFGRPQLLLHLIHFALFQNAFQITYFFWIWYSFPSDSCYHPDFRIAIIKVSIGTGVLCLCSYITLPLYALLTQMGSRMKRSVFDEQTSKALEKWRMTVKKRKEGDGKIESRRLGDGSLSPRGTTARSSGRTLHRYKTTGHSSTRHDNGASSELEAETEPLSPRFDLVAVRVEPCKRETEAVEIENDNGETSNGTDFSTAKPAAAHEESR
ncbi:PREDICTED: MLO-like protein 8 [Tarenaya hassleriana]|uniref:MLO-like protein 8 n=1 Tax=Tarenaya hassleriana TaxID=28532 RepID=UPI00053C6CD8|nr:PREDICTED: MLO-like protein 8 [Tarenaya hassleriana]XP_010548199.1 PREDICTED: MLO-like protein 8 [Tarenaya hassleriana]